MVAVLMVVCAATLAIGSVYGSWQTASKALKVHALGSLLVTTGSGRIA